ncbi:MAG: nucleoside phosphorylase [Ignavibacteria bacterium]|jgi:uridine phosphorylase|nr:nucleoside phosphorylase [Ignavibacteria bacterium]MCU7503429.1 nucleoside phosphorylase [Ignavibacteria bacterium]MCU7516239.1 nucleoside phosphorylase [Ignavibacteria bacterium]
MNTYPILEFDPATEAVFEPKGIIKPVEISECCVLTFFKDVIEKVVSEHPVRTVKLLNSEMGKHPVYEMEFHGKKVAFFHAPMGAPFAAAALEEIIALGCRKFIACGGAGVLDSSINCGKVVVPYSALRDEGTSYHYLPPSREVEPGPGALQAIKETLEANRVDYLMTKTWTTDAVYRETRLLVGKRKAEGCLVVEMEAAAFFAVSKFRGVKFAQMLYGGDDVSLEEWDHRNWFSQYGVRESLFWLSVEACLRIKD